MKTERELFDLWFKKNFHDLHEAICCGDLVAKNYKKAMFKAWQASTNREGYKLVPLDSLNEVISCAVTYISDRCNADEAQEVYDHIDRLEEDTL